MLALFFGIKFVGLRVGKLVGTYEPGASRVIMHRVRCVREEVK